MESYFRSKISLKILLIGILAIVINSGIVLILQMLLNYRTTGPIDAAALAAMDRTYEGCTILDHTENTANPQNDLHIYLVRTADGTEHLVTLRRHFLLDRYRLMKSACKPLPEGAQTVSLRAGTDSFGVNIAFNNVSGHNDISWAGYWTGLSARTRFRNNLLLTVSGLCALELAVWCLVFRKEEIQ